jgi:hypothetical protein
VGANKFCLLASSCFFLIDYRAVQTTVSIASAASAFMRQSSIAASAACNDQCVGMFTTLQTYVSPDLERICSGNKGKGVKNWKFEANRAT